MNQKRPYKSDEPAPEYLHEVKVNGHQLIKGMEASLAKTSSGIAGEYQFRYAEQLPTGALLLTFFGPVKRTKQRYRQVTVDVVKTVRLRTRKMAEQIA